MTSIDQLHYLQSDDGARLMAAIREFDPQPNSGLAVISKLRKAFPPEMVAAAMTVHLLRLRAREKFSLADDMWFTREGYEQATSGQIAEWRAKRFTTFRRIVDLCCGIGGDSIGLSALPSIEQLDIVDRDPVHLEMAVANTHLYSPDAQLREHLSDVTTYDLAGTDAVFIDPARRDEQGRHATGKSEPSLEWCVSLAERVLAVGIKLAPGLPHHLIPEGWGFETIAIGFDLKEAVLWSPAMRTGAWQATVVTQSGTETFVPVPGDPVELREPQVGQWLFDPNPAITRAGLVDDLARTIDAAKIDNQIGFLVADRAADTSYARCFRIVASIPWHERNLKQAVIDANGGEVVIRRRGLPGNVDDIQKRLRGSGSRSLFIAMTRLNDRPWAIVCDNASLAGASPEVMGR
jgi:hypothetical protein